MRHGITFILSTTLGIFLCLFTIGYAYYRTKDLIAGPIITIESPAMIGTVHSSITEIQGRIKNANQVTLNDRKIYVNEAGEFREKLLLAEGYNIISIKAEDRFKRKTSQKLELLFIN